jgi:hypothetical protein
MPTRPARRCVRCRQLFTGTACPTCHPPWEHPSKSWQGISKAGWAGFRADVLIERPVCEICRNALSTTVDHLDGCDYTTQLLDRGWVRALCEECHRKRTAAQSAAARRARPAIRD